MVHFSVTCSFSKVCWQLLNLNLRISSPPDSLQALHYLMSNVQLASKEGGHCLYSLVTVECSKSRSLLVLFGHCGMLEILVFRRTTISPAQLVRSSMCFYHDLFLCNASVEPLTQSRTSGRSYVASSSFLSHPLVSWDPPLLGVLKLNFGGSVTPSVATAGYIVRDSNG